MVQTLKLFPLVVIYMNGAFRDIDNSLLEAAESMGCKGVDRFKRVIMALTMPTILAAALACIYAFLCRFRNSRADRTGVQHLPCTDIQSVFG